MPNPTIDQLEADEEAKWQDFMDKRKIAAIAEVAWEEAHERTFNAKMEAKAKEVPA